MATTDKEKKLQDFVDKREYWKWAETARSPRVKYLRKAVWSKASNGASYLPGIKMDQK